VGLISFTSQAQKIKFESTFFLQINAKAREFFVFFFLIAWLVDKLAPRVNPFFVLKLF